MMRDSKTYPAGEPACQRRSDGDHLRFVVHRKKNEFKFDFTIELGGVKSWIVPDVPSMNPLDQRHAEEGQIEMESIYETSLDQPLTEKLLRTWDKGNYIPIDDNGNVLSELEALECLRNGSLKFFLQGKKLVGEFVLHKRDRNGWLLMKRHDEFALYGNLNHELEMAK